MIDAAAVDFIPGTVVRFDLDPEDVRKSSNLHFTAIRPAFGGKEGGIRHCEYRPVRAHLQAVVVPAAACPLCNL